MGILELVKEHLIEEAEKKGRHLGIEEGIEKGIEEGIEKGMTKGELAKAKKITIRIIDKYPAFKDEEIADLVEMPVKFVKQVRKDMKKK